MQGVLFSLLATHSSLNRPITTRVFWDLYPQKDVEKEWHFGKDYVLTVHWDVRVAFSALSGPKCGVYGAKDGGDSFWPRYPWLSASRMGAAHRQLNGIS